MLLDYLQVTPLLLSGRKIYDVLNQALDRLYYLFHWYVVSKLSISIYEIIFLCFHVQNEPILNDQGSIKTEHVMIWGF